MAGKYEQRFISPGALNCIISTPAIGPGAEIINLETGIPDYEKAHPFH